MIVQYDFYVRFSVGGLNIYNFFFCLLYHYQLEICECRLNFSLAFNFGTHRILHVNSGFNDFYSFFSFLFRLNINLNNFFLISGECFAYLIIVFFLVVFFFVVLFNTSCKLLYFCLFLNSLFYNYTTLNLKKKN